MLTNPQFSTLLAGLNATGLTRESLRSSTATCQKLASLPEPFAQLSCWQLLEHVECIYDPPYWHQRHWVLHQHLRRLQSSSGLL